MAHSDGLQALWDADKNIMPAEIVFRPRRGWYAEPVESRWFGDEGEWLGDDWKDALRSIEFFVNAAADADIIRAHVLMKAPRYVADIEAVLSTMPSEELAYWRAKCEVSKQGVKAFCILFAKKRKDAA